MQVESELEMATNEIEILIKRIEQGERNFSHIPMRTPPDSSKKHRVANGEGMASDPQPSASSRGRPLCLPFVSEQTVMTEIEVIIL